MSSYVLIKFTYKVQKE